MKDKKKFQWECLLRVNVAVTVIRYSGYFSGDKIFVVFMVERQTTNVLPTKQYAHTRLEGCGQATPD